MQKDLSQLSKDLSFKSPNFIIDDNKVYRILGMAKFDTTRKEFLKAAAKFAAKADPKEKKNKIFILGTVDDVIIQEIWFAEYEGEVAIRLTSKPKEENNKNQSNESK